MEKKSTLQCVFEEAVDALSSIIDRNRIFLMKRPTVTNGSKPMDKFVVVSLPINFEDYVIGDKKTLLESAGIIYLFTLGRKNGSLDLNKTGEFADDVMSLFPLKGKYIVCTKPVLQLKGEDDNGYQVVTITFDLRCRWEAFTEQ